MEFKDAVLRFIELSEEIKSKIKNRESLADTNSAQILETLNPQLYRIHNASLEPDDDFTKLLLSEALDCLHYLMHHSQENLLALVRFLNEKKDSEVIGTLPSVRDALSQALRKVSGLNKADLEYKVYCDYIVERAQSNEHSEGTISFMSRTQWKPYKKRGYPCFKEYHPDPSARWWELDRRSLPIAVGGQYRKKCYDYLRMVHGIPEHRLGIPVLAHLLLHWIRKPEMKAEYIFKSITFHREELASMIDEYRAYALSSLNDLSHSTESQFRDIFVPYVEGLKQVFQIFLSEYTLSQVRKPLGKLKPRFNLRFFLTKFLDFDAHSFAGIVFIKDPMCPVEGAFLDDYLVDFTDPDTGDNHTESSDDDVEENNSGI